MKILWAVCSLHSHHISGENCSRCSITQKCVGQQHFNPPSLMKAFCSNSTFVQAVWTCSTAESTHTAGPTGLRDYARLLLCLFCLTFINKSQGQIILPYICLQLTPAVFSIWTSCYVSYAKNIAQTGPFKALLEMPTDCPGQDLA